MITLSRSLYGYTILITLHIKLSSLEEELSSYTLCFFSPHSILYLLNFIAILGHLLFYLIFRIGFY